MLFLQNISLRIYMLKVFNIYCPKQIKIIRKYNSQAYQAVNCLAESNMTSATYSIF